MTNYIKVDIVFEKDLYEALVTYASEENMTLSELVRKIIDEYRKSEQSLESK